MRAPKSGWRSISVEVVKATPPVFLSEFSDVLAHRRTERRLESVAKGEALGLISHVFKPLAVADRPDGRRARKSVISAGALHPIDLIVATGPDVSEPLLFDDAAGLFLALAIDDRNGFDRSVERLFELAPDAQGHLIVAAGHVGRVNSAYENPFPLLWRDAGAVDQLMAMAAFAAGMRYLPLGALPIDLLNSIRGESEQVIGVGCGILGRPRS